MKTCIKCGYTRKPEDDAPEWQCPSCEVAYAKAEKAIELEKQKADLLAKQQAEEEAAAEKQRIAQEQEARRQEKAALKKAEQEAKKIASEETAVTSESIIIAKPVNKPIGLLGFLAIVGVIAFMIWFTVDSSGTVNPFSLGALVILFMGLGTIAAYLLPSLIAISRKHNAAVGIFVLNLFLGWTVLFWIIALVWSFSPNVNQEHMLVIRK